MQRLDVENPVHNRLENRPGELKPAGRARALRTLQEDHGVEIRAFPDDVMERLESLTWEYLEEIAAGDDLFSRVLKSYREYYAAVVPYSRISEQYLMNTRRGEGRS